MEEYHLSKSLFDDEKIIIIKRSTDKILKVLENIETKTILKKTFFNKK